MGAAGVTAERAAPQGGPAKGRDSERLRPILDRLRDAAFELTRREHEGRYQVTVYQIGWRLGGKGASARGPGGRIEEHGLHVWMGWYENAFRLVRECYAELGRDPRTCPIADWREAFAPAPFVGVAEHDGNGRWNVWKSLVPPTDGLPGDPPPDGPRWSMRDYLVRTAVLLRGLFQALQTARDGPSASDGAGAGEPAPEAVLGGIARLLEYGELATLAGLIQGAALLETVASLAGDQVFVSNEVGQGVIPVNALARRFADEAGQLHQRLAVRCERVVLMAAGLPLILKEFP